LFGDLRRNWLHLRLDLVETFVGDGGYLVRRDVDPVVFEHQRVLFGRKTKIVPRLGQYLGP